VWGVREGLRRAKIRLNVALAMAATLTALALPKLHESGQPWWNPPRWLLLAALTWPAWYLVTAAKRRRQEV
jgi:hypothetical protein